MYSQKDKMLNSKIPWTQSWTMAAICYHNQSRIKTYQQFLWWTTRIGIKSNPTKVQYNIWTTMIKRKMKLKSPTSIRRITITSQDISKLKMLLIHDIIWLAWWMRAAWISTIQNIAWTMTATIAWATLTIRFSRKGSRETSMNCPKVTDLTTMRLNMMKWRNQ